MWKELLSLGKAGAPLWLPEVRDTLLQAGGTPLMVRLYTFDGQVRDYAHKLPRWESDEERSLAQDYICATVYNALAVCGGYEMRFYTDTQNADIMDILSELPDLFQLGMRERRGLGKVISIADHMGQALGKGRFSFAVSDIASYSPMPAQRAEVVSISDRLRDICCEADTLNIIGIDIGGTDIKLAASRAGQLVAVKEHDWNPSAFVTAEELLDPIALLVRLMRACLAAQDLTPLLPALAKDAPLNEIARAVAEAEAQSGTGILDAVGVSFPDIVLHDCIVGGETPKTDGMRRNTALDYETEFAKLGGLKEHLLRLCRGKERCRIINDGNMAAFTTAMELCCDDAGDTAKGVVAHSLGTDLGTGWLGEDGRIPQMPLELYDVWMDLGSFPAAQLPPEDLRSTRNENSGLPSARRYLGQAAAYRLAQHCKPELLYGYTDEKGGILRIIMTPQDMRKPCLGHIMACADRGDEAAREVFRQIGHHLAVVSREFGFLLHPAADVRYLFGRFVKSDACFSLLREGFSEKMPTIRLVSGEDLVHTTLMRQLCYTG